MRFVTVFPQAENVHLRKGVGKIPFLFHQLFGYESVLLTVSNAIPEENVVNDTPGLIVEMIKNKNQTFQVLKYIFFKAAKIDILNLYSLSKSTFFQGLLYKILNPDGILYLKMDMNYEYLDRLTKSEVSKFHIRLWSWFFNTKCNLISYEAKSVGQLLQLFYSIKANRMHYMPIGIDLNAIRNLPFSRKEFSQKENIILAVGRIGIFDKNNEMLLDASLKLNLKDWKIVFVGPVHPDFKLIAEMYFIQNPEMKCKVLFTGNIDNFEGISLWYNRAKVFCLTSRQESGPTALTEAMYWGSYVVSTRLRSVAEMLDGGKLGSLIDNETQLVNALQYCIDNAVTLEEQTKFASQKIEQEFGWQILVQNLKNRLDSN